MPGGFQLAMGFGIVGRGFLEEGKPECPVPLLVQGVVEIVGRS